MFSDQEVLNLSVGERKSLSTKTKGFLESRGFTEAQINYLKNYPYGSHPSKGINLAFTMKMEDNYNEYINSILASQPVPPQPVPPQPVSVSPWTPTSPQNILNSISDIDDILEESSSSPQENTISSQSPPQNLSQLVHDLQVKYLECYVKMGDKIASIRDFTTDNNKIVVAYRLLKSNGAFSGVEYVTYHEDMFDYSLPKLGLINFKGGVVLVNRNHKKGSPSKYRKSLRSDTLSYIDLCRRERLSLGEPDYFSKDYFDTDNMFKIVGYDIMYPKMYSYEEALESVINFERLSSAFSSSMCIRLDSYTNKIVLNKYQWSIGEWSDKDKVWLLKTNTFNKDLEKLNIPFKEVA